jgi:hypothetical protein
LIHYDVISLIDQAFCELKTGKVGYEDLAFVAKLSKEPEEYKNENDRMKILARMSGAQRGDTVCWYETVSESLYGGSNKRTSTYSIKPDNLNFEKYKRLLLGKLNDILEITGFNIEGLRSQLLNHTMCHEV